jgi:hypothetical protein
MSNVCSLPWRACGWLYCNRRRSEHRALMLCAASVCAWLVCLDAYCTIAPLHCPHRAIAASHGPSLAPSSWLALMARSGLARPLRRLMSCDARIGLPCFGGAAASASLSRPPAWVCLVPYRRRSLWSCRSYPAPSAAPAHGTLLAHSAAAFACIATMRAVWRAA